MSDFFRGALATDCPEFASKFAKPETKKIYTLNKPINFPVQKFIPSKEDTYVFKDTETNKWYDIDGKEIEKPQNALKVRVLGKGKSSSQRVLIYELCDIYADNDSEKDIQRILKEKGLLDLIMNRDIGDSPPPQTTKEALYMLFSKTRKYSIISLKKKNNSAVFYCKKMWDYNTACTHILHASEKWEKSVINMAVEVIAGEVVRGLIGNRDNTYTMKSDFLIKFNDELKNNKTTAYLCSRDVKHGLPWRHNEDKTIIISCFVDTLRLKELATRIIIDDCDGHPGNVLQWISADNKIHTVGYDYGYAYSRKFPDTTRSRIISALKQVIHKENEMFASSQTFLSCDLKIQKLYIERTEDDSLYIDVLVDLLERSIIMFTKQKILLESQDYIECMFATSKLPSPELKAKELVQFLHKESLFNMQLYANFLYVIATGQWDLEEITSVSIEESCFSLQDAENITEFCQKYHLHTRIHEVLTRHDMMDMLTVPLQQKPPSPVPQQELTALTTTDAYVSYHQEI